MDKKSLLEKIKTSDHLTDSERAYLVELLNTKKKYGLVWEDKPEDAEELLRTHLPVLREVEERRITPPQPSPKGRESALNENTANLQEIKSETYATQTLLFDIEVDQIDSSTSKTKKIQNEQTGNLQNEQQLQQPNLPPLGGGPGRGVNHILIEGDNLHALTALTFTHEGKVDVMYFDPPYNTGNKDFKYNDSFVDKEDSYRHSKWLSFMHKRLEIAKRLLSDKGVVFISIDDNEQAQLKMLCNEVFGEGNFIGNPVRRRRGSQANLSKNISTIHEYVLIYGKSASSQLNNIKSNLKITDYKNPDKDIRGPYVTMPCTNKGGAKYSVVTPTGIVISEEWRFKEETYYKLLNDNRLVFPRNGAGKPRYKLFLSEKEDSGVIDNSWWETIATNQEATIELKDIFNRDVDFNNPKPVGLIKHILNLTTDNKKSSIILDFFAGSGTTLHATMQLNAEDGGNRQCILVTNNENNICEEVTYERNKRVIEGYTNAKGVQVAGLQNNNLRYYRTEFVGRERSLKNKRTLVHAATQMLCVKEDIYSELTEVAGETIDKNNYRCFTDNDRYMLVIYNEEVIEELVPLIAKIESKHKIKIYVFAPGQYPYTEEFEDVLPKVELCALPDAIYKAYANVLPKKKAKDIENNEAMNHDTVGVASL